MEKEWIRSVNKKALALRRNGKMRRTYCQEITKKEKNKKIIQIPRHNQKRKGEGKLNQR